MSLEVIYVVRHGVRVSHHHSEGSVGAGFGSRNRRGALEGFSPRSLIEILDGHRHPILS